MLLFCDAVFSLCRYGCRDVLLSWCHGFSLFQGFDACCIDVVMFVVASCCYDVMRLCCQIVMLLN